MGNAATTLYDGLHEARVREEVAAAAASALVDDENETASNVSGGVVAEAGGIANM